jgi:surfeit locus 1 family protein
MIETRAGCASGAVARRGIGRATVLFAVFALALSAGCVRLGFWQISRWRERIAVNEQVISRLYGDPRPVASMAGDTGIRFRRAFAEGQYDFDLELVHTTRARNGAPGVHILTPLRWGDSAVLVNRGWVYTPDGMHVDHSLWREQPSARVEGYVERYADSIRGPVSTPSVEHGVRALAFDSIQAKVPYPLLPVIIVQRLDSGEAASLEAGTPVRVDPPPLSEGSHRAYAVQWFAFALVGIVGTGLVLARDRRRSVR